MIRLSITHAFDAIVATLALGSLGFEPAPAESGERAIWVETAVVDQLTALRQPGESYSDLVLRLIKLEVG